MATHVLTPEVLDVALTLMSGLDCPRSLTVAILLRAGEWEQIAKLTAKPSDYSTGDEYFRAVQASDFLRKYPGLSVPGLDIEAASFQKWLWAEKECFKTNRRLNELADFGTVNSEPAHPRMLEFFQLLRKNVELMIGAAPPQEIEGRFGPGATVSDRSERTTVAHKLSSLPTFTPSAFAYLVPWSGSKWAMACAARWDVPVSVRGNSYFTVPKTALIRRTCGKEPSLNVFYQLGYGRAMRRRLLSAGLDLQNGQQIHQQRAREASLSDDDATIDLTSASDCLCTALVRLALPPSWHSALDDLRSPYTRVKGRWYRLEKFSSMGNGFTFELETVIFAAIALTVMGQSGVLGWNVHVYGDDIIVPKQFSSDVIWALKFCGFTPNPDKTFTSGPFRESCGGDYWLGQVVRPYQLDQVIEEPQHLISLVNGIRRACEGSWTTRWQLLRKSWFKAMDYIPSPVRQCRGPKYLGDLVIHDDEERWRVRWRSCIRYVQVYRPVEFQGTRWERFDPDVQFAAALYGISFINAPKGQVLDSSRILARKCVTGYAVGWLPYS